MEIAKISTKARGLSFKQLGVIAILVYAVRINSTLFHPQLVIDGAHNGGVPLWKSSPVGHPSIQILKTLVSAARMIGGNYGILPDYHIEGRFCIQEDGKNWSAVFIQAVLNYLR